VGRSLLAIFPERRTPLHAEMLNAQIDGGMATLEARRLPESLYAQGGLP